MNDRSLNLVRFLVARGLDNLEGVPMCLRADAFEAAALLLDGGEAEEASAIAYNIRASEERQAEFLDELLSK
jgi:hypothetical protein